MDEARKHYKIGNTLRSEGKDTCAIKEYEKALAMDPSFWMAKKSIEFLKQYIEKKHVSFGSLYESEGKTQEAIQEYKKASDVSPSSWRIWKKLGSLYKDAYQLEKAALAVKKSIKLSPTTSALYLLLGNIQDIQEKYPDAIRSYEIALRFSPQNKEILKQKKLSHKLHDVATKLTQSPKSASIYIDIASLFLEKDMPEGAITLLKRGIKKFSYNQEMYFMLGNIHYNLSTFTQAGNFYKKSLQCKSTIIPSEEIHYNIALTFAAQEKWKEAVHEWEQCMKLSGRSRAALRAKANLELISKKRYPQQ